MSGMIVVNGAKPLCGTVRVPAAKNSVLPIMAASLLCEGEVKLARSFGKGALFTVGLIVFDPIFELILGYGGSEYIGNMSAETE